MAANKSFNPFDHPIPGSSLTKPVGGSAWQKPPKYTKIDDACQYLFTQLTKEASVRHLQVMFKEKVPLEAIARVVLMSGFSEGLWTPDLALSLGHPLMYMLAAISKRLGVDAPITSTDRTGMKDIVNFKRMSMSSQGATSVEPNKTQSTPKIRGLLQPAGQ